MRYILLVLCVLVIPGLAHAQEGVASDPLSRFERVIGGKWHFEGGYQTMEWGVGRLSVRARSYFIVDDKPQLVSEGIWFYHPGTRQVRGYFTAVEMPVQLFDYVMSFDDDQIVGELTSYTANGEQQNYREVWDFADDNHYRWRLLRDTSEGEQEYMVTDYVRRFGEKKNALST